MKDVVIEAIVLYIGLFGAVVYRWGDVYMAFWGVTGVLLSLFPLILLAHRRAFQRWLSSYKQYPYSFIALALVPMSCGVLIISTLFQ